MTSTDQLSRKELAASLELTRQRLASNLDALEDKLNVPKQLGKASDKFKRRMSTMREENPIGFAGVVAAGIVAVGLTGYLVVKIASRRFKG